MHRISIVFIADIPPSLYHIHKYKYSYTRRHNNVYMDKVLKDNHLIITRYSAAEVFTFCLLFMQIRVWVKLKKNESIYECLYDRVCVYGLDLVVPKSIADYFFCKIPYVN